MSCSLNGISKPFAADVFIRYIYKTHKGKKIEEEGMKSDSRTQERRNELLSISFIFFFSTSVYSSVRVVKNMRSKASLHQLKS